MTKGISRRNFLTGAALASVAAGAGLAGCAPSADKKTTEAVGAADSAAQYEWEKAPEPISDIAETVDTDILVIGAGLSGCACACSAAENGGKVTVVEKTESWQGRGGGFGAINSRYMDQLGIKVDKVNAKQHWISQCASRANEDLIVKFFNNSEEASNWLLDKAEAAGCAVMVGAFYSHDDVYAEQPGYHMCMKPEGSDLKSTGFVGAEVLYNDAVKAGAEFVFNSPAVQLVKDGGCWLYLRSRWQVRSVQRGEGRRAVHGRHRWQLGDVQGLRAYLRRIRPAAQPVHPCWREHGRWSQDGYVGWRATARFAASHDDAPPGILLVPWPLPVRERQRRALYVRRHLGSGQVSCD